MKIIIVSQRKITDRRDNKYLINEIKKNFSRIINISFDDIHLDAPYGKDFLDIDYELVRSVEGFIKVRNKYNCQGNYLLNLMPLNQIGRAVSNLFCKTRNFDLMGNDEIYFQYVSAKKRKCNKFYEILKNPLSYYFGIKQRLFIKALNAKQRNIIQVKSKTFRPVLFPEDYNDDDILIPSKEFFIKKEPIIESYIKLSISSKYKYVAYIDQNFRFHPDYNGRLSKNKSTNFYTSIIPIFEFLNKNGYKVLFCPHPSIDREQYSAIKNDFKGIDMVFSDIGLTMSAVKVSDYIISHYSIALLFAMFDAKPSLLIKTMELSDIGESEHVDLVSDLLDINMLDISNGNNELSLDSFKVPRQDYIKFKNLAHINNQYEYLLQVILGSR